MSVKQELREFLRKHHACKEGAEWALTNCKSMAEVWGLQETRQ